MPALFLSIRFHDGRYHGMGDWPPSPARLFQALIAGAAHGEKLSDEVVKAFKWLEGLAAPTIAAPPAHPGCSVKNFVPNNDLDAVDGDPTRVGEIRAAKLIRPHLFNAAVPLVYAWKFEDNEDSNRCAEIICEIADNLYQLGRGVDMAWAIGEILTEAKAEERLRAHGGAVRRPDKGGEGETLLCPHPGSLASLITRFNKTRDRFRRITQGKKASVLFTQAPKPNFNPIPYSSPATFYLFDIKKGDKFVPRAFDRIVEFTEKIRDLAVQRLKASSWRGDDSKRDILIEKIFIGRDANEADKALRIRITPLPSIGHTHASHSIRRVLVTIPPDCPIVPGDIAWAFSGLSLESDKETGEITELVPAGDRAMLQHYSVEDSAPARLWRTVTPVALPERAARRRIDPHRLHEEAKGGAERARENAAAESAVRHALRHAGIETPVQAIRVQREPFEAKGKRAEAFAKGSRFAKERLWHVMVTFAEAIRGPLLIGDGRYLGLGLMAPVRRTEGIFAFGIADGLTGEAEPLALAKAIRRAVMARVQERIGDKALPAFFTGHAADGTPLRNGRHQHLTFIGDIRRNRLLIVAPHILERRKVWEDERKQYLPFLEDAVADFRELRAGAAGKLVLFPTATEQPDDPIFTTSRVWKSTTPYHVTRHAKLRDAVAALKADILAECLRAGLPRPRIDVLETFGKPGVGLFGRAQLTFHTAIAGPLILGRDRHFGGGLFETLV